MSEVAEVRNLLQKSFSEDIRNTQLNVRPHFIPLNLAALEVSMNHVLNTNEADIIDQGYGEFISIKDLLKDIKNFVKARHKKSIVVGQPLPEDFLHNIKEYTPAVVYDGGDIVGTLYPSYSSAYDGLFKNFLKDKLAPYFKESRYSESGTKIKRGVDVGHIISGNIAATPLQRSIENLISTLDNVIGTPKVGTSAGDALNIRRKLEESLKTLEDKSSYGRRVEVTLTKELSGLLSSISANVVIIQDRLENQYYYGSMVESAISQGLTALLKSVHFSPSLEEEMVDTIAKALTGNSTKKNKKVSKVLDPILVKQNTKVSLTTSDSTRVGVQKLQTAGVGTSGMSLISLQTLLNTHLQDVISANMGAGNATSILNYRTGRFAASATVERMSISREGMISAFYSYMKYPYATFSQGGKQAEPPSRDPKLLIAKSIREIAATKVANRMRSILI